MRLLEAYDVELGGKHAVVVGRSAILGKPAGMLLLAKDATVTYCHSRTTDLSAIVREADVVVAAVGRPRLIRGEDIKPGAVVIDAGYNPGNVGDVDYDTALTRARLITPVPGGVGPMTIAVLLAQTVEAAADQLGIIGTRPRVTFRQQLQDNPGYPVGMLTPDQNDPQSGESPDMPEVKVASAGVPAADLNQLDFPPVRNGVDYLVSVVEHLAADQVDSRGIKYAVLHLHAAAEVLLKARLVREHWSLVFDDPGQATERAFRSGDFKSCTLAQAVARLRNIAGITITRKEDDALGDLGRDRNALQHYGLTHNARAVEARAGRVLDFLVRFLDDVLLPDLDLDEANAIGADMVHVRDGLTGVQAFITQRLRRLRGDLEGREERTVHCSECEQLTMVADGETNRCLFCGVVVTTTEMMVYVYLGSPEDEGSLIGVCPRCGKHTLVDDVGLATGDRMPFCFGCPGPVPSSAEQSSADAPGGRR